MPDALLLSPDDQAVNAITGVLEEMSVSCERPLDGISAAQKLSSHNYDLVLVDCENLPAAKLIFDVCRRGKNGHNPVPIAIVDGRAGLPTAFRLGAELILTKPVAKDQARSTIRTAVGRVRKDKDKDNVPAESIPNPTASVSAPPAVAAYAPAVAAATTASLTSFADSAPTITPSAVHAPGAVATAPALGRSALAPSAPVRGVTSAPAAAATHKPAPLSSLSKSSPATAPPSASEGDSPLGDDPVLAELEMAELELANPVKPEVAEPAYTDSSKINKTVSKEESAAAAVAPVFSSYSQRQKPRGALVALLMLAIAAAGFYAAWTYQPGFRATFQAVAQPQIDRVLSLLGVAVAPTPANPVPAPVRAAAPVAPAASNSTTPASPDSATNATSGTPDATEPSLGRATPAQSGTGSKTGVTSPATAPPASATTPTVSKAEAAQPNSTPNIAAASPVGAPLPGESSVVILSSKGAEKRLEHSVAPKYPVDARASGAEGTVVLKEVVDANGKVTGVRLVEGDATLATAAMQAVKQWRYRPYIRDGKVEPFQTVVILDFQRP